MTWVSISNKYSTSLGTWNPQCIFSKWNQELSMWAYHWWFINCALEPNRNRTHEPASPWGDAGQTGFTNVLTDTRGSWPDCESPGAPEIVASEIHVSEESVMQAPLYPVLLFLPPGVSSLLEGKFQVDRHLPLTVAKSLGIISYHRHTLLYLYQ